MSSVCRRPEMTYAWETEEARICACGRLFASHRRSASASAAITRTFAGSGKDADDDCFTGKRDCAIASPKTTVNTSRTHKRKGMPAITFTNEITHLRTIKRRRESQLKTLYWGTLNLG